jgi:hypothetical protein
VLLLQLHQQPRVALPALHLQAARKHLKRNKYG